MTPAAIVIVDHGAPRLVTEWLDEADAAQDGLGAVEGIGFFLSPDQIADAYKAIDDDEVREALELSPRRYVTRTHRIEFLELYRLPGMFDDGEVAYLARVSGSRCRQFAWNWRVLEQ